MHWNIYPGTGSVEMFDGTTAQAKEYVERSVPLKCGWTGTWLPERVHTNTNGRRHAPRHINLYRITNSKGNFVRNVNLARW